MQARIATSVRASITRAALPWQSIRFFQRESKVGGHNVRSVPVRGDTIAQAPATLVHAVVENEELQAAMTSLNISELTEIQARLRMRSRMCSAVVLLSGAVWHIKMSLFCT